MDLSSPASRPLNLSTNAATSVPDLAQSNVPEDGVRSSNIDHRQYVLRNPQSSYTCIAKSAMHCASSSNLKRNYPDTSVHSNPPDPKKYVGVSVNNATNSNIAGQSIHQTNYISHHYPSVPEKNTDISEDRKTAVKSWLLTTSKKRATSESGKMNFPSMIDRPIHLVALQLSNVSTVHRETLDDHGHYNRRSDFELIMKKRSGNIKLTNIFSYANERATYTAENTTKTPAARQEHIDRYGKTVALIGQAGIGKTTLARTTVRMFLDGKLPHNIKFVFFLQFRSVNFAEAVTLSQLLLLGADVKTDNKPVTDTELLTVLGDGEDVALVYDALDEANTAAFRNADPLPFNQPFTADVYIKLLLSVKLLPKALKLITSRPRQFMEMHEEYRPSCVIDVLGLDDSAQRDLCKQICKNRNAFDQVMKFLNDNPDIGASCYVVAKCILIMYVLNKSINENGYIDVKSITDIFVQVLGFYIRGEHTKAGADDLKKLATFAMTQFQKGKITFTANDFWDSEIDKAAFESFLVTFTDQQYHVNIKILDGDLESYFSHLIWQELFSAIHLFLLMPLDEFESNITHFHESRWEVVAKFTYGLCNTHVRHQIGKIFNIHNDHTWEVTKSKLKDLAVESMKEVGPSDTTKLLTLCSWLREMKDDEVTREVLQYLPSDVKLKGLIIQTDVPSLTYVLRFANEPNLIVRDECNFSEGCFKVLLKSLAGVKLKFLDLHKVLDDDQCKLLGHLLPNINDLKLKDCGLSSTHVEIIFRSICSNSGFGSWLESLDLSNNRIGDEGVSTLVPALHNINRLNLARCKLTSKGIAELVKVYKTLTKPLEALDLSGNRIGNEGVSALVPALHNINHLKLTHCQLTSKVIVELAKVCKTLTKPLESLDLTCNQFGDKGASALVPALHNINHLNLSRCELTSKGIGELAKVYETLTKPINTLNICGNVVGREAFDFLATCWKNIREVTFNRYEVTKCQINRKDVFRAKGSPPDNFIKSSDVKFLKIDQRQTTINGDVLASVVSLHISQLDEVKLTSKSLTSIGVRELAYAIKQRTKPLELLDLSDNQIGDEGASVLVPALHNINRLNLSSCELTSKGIGELAKVFETLTKPLESLDLSHNRIGDEGVSELVPVLHNINRLNLSRCKLTSDGIGELAKVYKMLSKSIKSLNICGNMVGREAFDFLSTCSTNIEEIIFTRHKMTSGKVVRERVFQRKGNLTDNFIITSDEDDMKLSRCDLTPIDVRELAYAIKQRTKPVESLDLSDNPFGDEGVSALVPALHNIHHLKLSCCELTSKGISELAKLCKTLTNPMSELDLSSNSIGNQGAQHIASVMHKVDRLKLSNCKLSQNGIKALSKDCKQRATPMNELDLSKNKVGDLALKEIAFALHKIERLKLSCCEITQAGIKALSEACSRREMPISELDLSSQSIGDLGAKAIASALSKIDRLKLRECGVTHKGIKALSKACNRRESPMSELDLSSNSIGDQGAQHIASAMHKIDRLKLSNCKITQDEVKVLIEACKQRATPLESMDLSDNPFGDEGASALVPALHCINRLNVSRCQLTSKGIGELAKVCETLTKPLESLDLSNNPIGDEGASALVPGLHNINRLNVSSCKLTSKGIGELAKVYKTLTKPIKSLNICGNVVGREAFDFLSTCWTNIEEIIFTRYKVTSDNIVEKDVFHAKGNPLENVILSSDVKCFHFSGGPSCLTRDVLAAVVSLHVSQLDEVNLSFCGLTPIGVRELAYAIKQRTKPMSELDLSKNSVGNQGAQHIASALHKIDRLILRNCEITQDGIKALIEACKQRATPMSELDLSKNSVGNQGAQHIASALHKIDRLNLRYCEITQDGIKALSEACKQRATPMVLLDLRLNCDIDRERFLADCQHNVQELIL